MSVPSLWTAGDPKEASAGENSGGAGISWCMFTTAGGFRESRFDAQTPRPPRCPRILPTNNKWTQSRMNGVAHGYAQKMRAGVLKNKKHRKPPLVALPNLLSQSTTPQAQNAAQEGFSCQTEQSASSAGRCLPSLTTLTPRVCKRPIVLSLSDFSQADGP